MLNINQLHQLCKKVRKTRRGCVKTKKLFTTKVTKNYHREHKGLAISIFTL